MKKDLVRQATIGCIASAVVAAICLVFMMIISELPMDMLATTRTFVCLTIISLLFLVSMLISFFCIMIINDECKKK